MLDTAPVGVGARDPQNVGQVQLQTVRKDVHVPAFRLHWTSRRRSVICQALSLYKPRLSYVTGVQCAAGHMVNRLLTKSTWATAETCKDPGNIWNNQV